MANRSDLRFRIHFDADVALDVVRFDLEEGLSRPFRLSLELSSESDDIDLDALLDTEATFAIECDSHPIRNLLGVCTMFERCETGFRRTRYRAVIEPALARLGLWHGSQIHQQQTVPDILRERLAQRGVQARITALRSHETREYCVQHRETELGFVSRLAAEEGFVYYFDPRQHSQLVLTDQLISGPRLPGADDIGTVAYQPNPGGDAGEPRLWHFGLRRQLAPTRTVQRDTTFRNPQYSLEHRSDARDGVGEFEHYDAPGRYKRDEVGKPFTATRLQQLRTGSTIATLEGDDARLWPGLSFLLADHKQARALQKLDDERNDAEVARLYLKAAERNHYKAINNLSILYADGTSVPQDDEKALELTERLVQMNVPMGYYAMGIHLQQGIGVKPDKTAALAYFRRSADLGYRYGMWATGDEILTAFALEPEPDKSRGEASGIQMLECALGQGLAEAGHTLGMHFVMGDVGRAMPYFQKAASLGHSQSLFMLYAIFDKGEDGMEKDPRRAACYNQMRSEQDEEPGKAFPDIDQRCPLPPPPPTELQSGQPAPRIGLWRGRDDDSLFFRVSERDQALPTFNDQAVHWKWLPTELTGARCKSGERCPWPGAWASEDVPTGARLMSHGQFFPQIDGRDVTWRLVRAS